MCLSANEEPVEISGTTEVALKVEIGGVVHHALAYSLTLDSEPEFKPKGNMIMVPVRAKAGTIELREVKRFDAFRAWQEAVKPFTTLRSMSKSEPQDVQVVKNYDGLYDVVIARSADAIPAAIVQVDPQRRPEIREELFNELSLLYPKDDGWHMLLFCFTQMPGPQVASCLLTFEPVEGHEDDLFAGSLDGHSGAIERRDVYLDCTLAFGSHTLKDGVNGAVKPNWINRSIVDAYPWIDVPVRGVQFAAGTPCSQGDFTVSALALQEEKFPIRRVLPSGWELLPDKPFVQPPYNLKWVRS